MLALTSESSSGLVFEIPVPKLKTQSTWTLDRPREIEERPGCLSIGWVVGATDTQRCGRTTLSAADSFQAETPPLACLQS